MHSLQYVAPSNATMEKRKVSASAPLPKQKKGKKERARKVDELADRLGKIQPQTRCSWKNN